ncbi:MAG TPA: hypothetical protein VGM51_13635 [Armatimonadota bacterium]
MIRRRERPTALNVVFCAAILLVPVVVIVLIGRAVSAPNRDIYWCMVAGYAVEFVSCGIWNAIAARRRRP